jgi:hypothetical protein
MSNVTKTKGTKGKLVMPPFPKTVEVGIIKEFVDLYDPCTEAPREFLWSSFVTTLGNAIAPYACRDHAYPVQPRLYIVNVGASGSSKKSTAANLATEFVQNALGHGSLRLIPGFGSPEGVLRALSFDQHVPTVLYLDELEGFMKKVSIQNSAGTIPFHTLYDRNSYEHPLKVKGTKLDGVHLSILGNSTTDRFVDIWDAEHIDSGFFYRWTIVFATPFKRFEDPKKPQSEKVDALAEKLRGLLKDVKASGSGQRLEMTFEDDNARKIWADYYHKELDPKNDLHTRIDTFGERLMMILALAQGQKSISGDVVRATIDFLRYQVALRRQLAPIAADNIQAKTQNKILRALSGGPLPKRELERQVHWNRVGTKVCKDALDGLVEETFVQFDLITKEYRLVTDDAGRKEAA